MVTADFCLEEVAFGRGFGQTAPVFGFAGALVETVDFAFGFGLAFDFCTAGAWHETRAATVRATRIIHNRFVIGLSL